MSVARTRAELREAITRASIARGEAQWINGYRAATEAMRRGQVDSVEENRLYQKERERFALCAEAEMAVERALRAYARAVKKAGSK